MAWSGCGDAKGPDAAEPPAVHGEETPAKAAREPAAVEGAEPATKVEPAEPTTPGVRDDGEIVSAVSWFHGSLEQALAEAKAQDKLVLMDVGAYWCPPCHQLDEEVFVRPEVGEPLAAGYVAMHVDAEKGEGPELVERYHVQAFPTILVLEPSGLEKGRIVDFLPAEALLAALERLARGDNVLAELADAVQSDPDDLGKRYALGHALLLAADAEAAAPELEAVLLGDPGNELGLAGKVLYDQAMFVTYKLQGDLEGAIVALRELQRRYPESKDAVRAHRTIGRLQCALGREDEAVASLQAMVATDPKDPGLASSFGWFSFRQKCGVTQGLAAVQQGIVLAPDDADLRYVEAELLHLQGRDGEALAAIRKASELEPKAAFYRRQVRRFEALVEGAG
ncbi:MAG: thioredoxin family protein [Myxococcales bacterium]|nr:thioredoxin family protein [Myxococcales bacterium]